MLESDNNLDFNQSKCKVLTITRKKTPLVYVYHMNSKELLRVDKEKDLGDLGVCVSANFNWDVQIHSITGNANKMLWLLKRTCPLLRDKTVRRTLYFSLVRSQLCYGSEVWSPHTVKLRSRVECVQRRATAWILHSKHGEMAYQQRPMNLNVLPLCYEREISDLVFLFKVYLATQIWTSTPLFPFPTTIGPDSVKIPPLPLKSPSVNPTHSNHPISTD
jgi:hypothetical protein